MSEFESLALVNEIAKLGPVPPPIIVRQGEAGPPEDPTSSVALTWTRPASPIHLHEHSRKPYEMSLSSRRNFKGTHPPELKLTQAQLPSLKNSFWYEDFLESTQKISPGLQAWLWAYVLNNHLTNEFGKYYLSLIGGEDLIYPEPVQTALIHLIEKFREDHHKRSYPPTRSYQWEPPSSIDWYPQLMVSARSVELYLPRSLSPQNYLHLFLTGVYWLRSFRPERARLNPLLENFNPIDLYLVSANLFDRYPARKLLSYYSDHELYARFGRVGNYYFFKNYSSKQQQLDGLVALSLYRFGYFTVERWTRPVQLTFNQWVTLKDLRQTPIRLDELIASLNVRSEELTIELPGVSLMAVLKLVLMVQASIPLLMDRESWQPLLDLVDQYAPSFYQEYEQLHSHPHQLETNRNPNHPTFFEVPDEFHSLEQKFSLCLLCFTNQDQAEFGLCGHGVCSNCQALLGMLKCPFCTEHFTAEGLSDRFVSVLSGAVPITSSDQKRLMDRAHEIQRLKSQRDFKFDWANSDYRIFRGQ